MINSSTSRADIIRWLLEGDVSIQYQVFRDLLGEEHTDLRQRISSEGWGDALLSKRGVNGHWGLSFYQPKWISSHYTLLDLRYLEVEPTPEIMESINMIFRDEKGEDGGINPSGTIKESDLCINGMALNYGCFFGIDEKFLHSVVDFTLSQKMPDGGFNCMKNRSGAIHSSLHTTISAAEGICEYRRRGYTYRLREMTAAEYGCREFILTHRLFKSDKTGKIIKESFTKLVWPARWYYDILRALEYFRYSGSPYDDRMSDALYVLAGKRRKDGLWPNQAAHPGQVHMSMEPAGKAGRWNTLRAMRVLETFGFTDYNL
ncbi:MAG: hypothetical protein JEY99_08955 [Spirochaetales bacterium]|nr:hypothetical protein [Spirochaetales bacterium]